MKYAMRLRFVAGFVLAFSVVLSARAAVSCTYENSAVPETTPTATFTVYGDGTAMDTTTGLVWMRCSLGQSWDGSACSGSATYYTWQGALDVARDTNSGASNADGDGQAGYAGMTDWRLPNKNELESIVEARCWLPSINAAVFPNTIPGGFLSSSPNAKYSNYAWYVRFSGGGVYYTYKDYNYYVRLVRAGQ